MENWEPLIKKIVELMGFGDYRVEIRPEQKRGSIYIYDNESLIKEKLPEIVESFNHVFQLVAQKNEWPPLVFDVNNYRQERERLIAELARAAAKKVSQTKKEVNLPSMNSYERRIVHVELAVHPEVTTESSG
ncbi:MAG: R3H domain-containing nucleic acid-binding protein, partial [bacterium]|nr:R3H domain-containing nucleic acid-binding protein [bacterium]